MDKLLVKVATEIVVVIILTAGGCSAHKDYRISQAIKNGSDPVIARLAYCDGGSYERTIHVVKMENKTK